MKTIEERIAEKTRVMFSGCWEWIGTKTGAGYGQIMWRGRRLYVHRVVLEDKPGRQLSTDECACHSCDHPPCVNPDHLWPGTKGDNLRDMTKKGRHGAQVHIERWARGERQGLAKLDWTRVKELRLLRSQGRVLSTLADRFRVSQSTISSVVRRKTWKETR